VSTRMTGRHPRESTFGVKWTRQSDPTALYGRHWLKTTNEIYLLTGPLLPPFLPGLLEGTEAGNILPAFNDDQYEMIVLGKARRACELQRASRAGRTPWVSRTARGGSWRVSIGGWSFRTSNSSDRSVPRCRMLQRVASALGTSANLS